MNHRDLLIVGAGELGMAMLQGFSQRSQPHSDVRISVLLRPGSTSVDPEVLRKLRVRTVEADLNQLSEAELSEKLRPFHAVINCCGYAAGPGTQMRITRAALQAGVRRYLPWQFGVDYDAIGYGSGQPVWDEQLDVRATLRAQNSTHWLIVSTGMFTSFLFEPAFGVVDLTEGKVRALGDWDYRLTLTTPEDIGRCTAEIFFTEPEINDQVVFIAGDTLSYRELRQQLEQVTGRRFEAELLDQDSLRDHLVQNPGDLTGAYRLAFARPDGVAWDAADTFNAQRGLPTTTTTVRAWLQQQQTNSGRVGGGVGE